MPSGFTFNYVFEFFEDEGVAVCLCENQDLVSKLMWKGMFGDVGLKDVRVSDIKLPRHPVVELNAKKKNLFH